MIQIWIFFSIVVRNSWQISPDCSPIMKGKTRLSSVPMRNELFKSMEGGIPEQHRRNWQLIENYRFGGDSIANKLRGHGKLYRAILLDVSKRLKLKADKEMSTFEIEQQLLNNFCVIP